jgi:hypothetical protein
MTPKLIKNISLLLCSLIFSIGAVEGLLFIFYEYGLPKRKFQPAPAILMKHEGNSHILVKNSILYVNRPMSNYRTFGYKFSSNFLGFREKNFSLKKTNNTFRILVFGDSFTFGIGIDSDHRYTKLLGEMLNTLGSNTVFEVLNFGMGGYSTDQEHDLIKAILKIVECDLIIIGFCFNDLSVTNKASLSVFADIGDNGYEFPYHFIRNKKRLNIFENKKRNFNSINSTEPLKFSDKKEWYQKTNVYQFIEHRTNINLNGKLPNTARWEYALREFRGILSLTQNYNLPSPILIPLIFGDIDPDRNNFKNPKGGLAQLIRLYQFVGTEVKNEGYKVVDTLPLFEKYTGMSMATSEWETHPNYLGHYIYAKATFDFLIANKIISL